jgi:RHS repeat-associated protein
MKPTVNTQPAKVMSTRGNAPYTFEALVDLADGDNTVTIEAEDGNGNVATQSYSVTAGGVQKTLEYDLNGNLRYEKNASGTVLREFQWDAKNRLVKLIDGTHETQFVYDGFDRRVRIVETDNNVEQSNKVYVWSDTQMMQRRSSDGATIERSYFNQGFEESGNDYYYTKDHLGSIREVVASDGMTIKAVYDYSPWGEVSKVGGTGTESDFLYTGHFYHDKSDLHLTLYRAYNPELGMWLSRDPIAENGGLNLYAYVGNNPINLWDPLGLCKESRWRNAWEKFKDTTSGELGVGLGLGVKGKLGPVQGSLGADMSLSGSSSLNGEYKTTSRGSIGGSLGYGNHTVGANYGSSSYLGGSDGGGGSNDSVLGYKNKSGGKASATSVGASATLGVVRVGVKADPIAVAKELLKDPCD